MVELSVIIGVVLAEGVRDEDLLQHGPLGGVVSTTDQPATEFPGAEASAADITTLCVAMNVCA